MNALLDRDFLKELDDFQSKEVYARITALDINELPIETVEGQITGGSVNIDGTSAMRRTCSLSLVAEDVNINDFYWGLNNKFKLEVGLKNFINPIYPEIIWFPLGMYIITSFNTSATTNNFNISISGKDKMCLLNGEVGGSLPASIDFGTEEYVEGDMITYSKIPLKKIIREMLHTYALEPYHNIVINDLDDKGLELLEYRGDMPMYLLYHIDKQEYTNMEFDGKKECWIVGGSEVSLETVPNYNDRIDKLVEEEATKIYFEEKPEEHFLISKVEYGQTVGYRLTDLTYAGDLISNIGESITSILDKIIKMLGNFEYFYDTDGRFIFQQKKTYINTAWSPIVETDEDMYVENAHVANSNTYHFDGNNLISSFSNAPNLTNIKNDYSVWGVRKSVSGAEIPVHFRYAIHNKPKYYKSFGGKIYIDTEYDWREIIYQMALDYYKHNQDDDFNVQLTQNNIEKKDNGELINHYPNGTTGYEQFYIDLQGFWRQLYDPQPSVSYYEYHYDNNKEKQFIPINEYGQSVNELFLNETYEQLNKESKVDRSKIYVLKDNELHNLIDTIPVKYVFDEDGNQDFANQHEGGYPRYCITDGSEVGYKYITESFYQKIEKKEIYFEIETNHFVHILDTVDLDGKCFLKKSLGKDKYIKVSDLPDEIEGIYCQEKEGHKEFNKYYTTTKNDNITVISQQPPSEEEVKPEIIYTYLIYYIDSYDFYRDKDFENVEDSEKEKVKYLYWNKQIQDNPDTLNYWLDFLDANIGTVEESELSQYAISAIGNRPKVVNDSDVKSIYYRNVPNLIFTTNIYEEYKEKTGYVFMQITKDMNLNYFTISAQGKSAKDAVDELLYQHSYGTESINITSIPVYYLQPNTRISVRDDLSKINGEYIVNRISLSLAYNGQMTIQATKAPQRFN